MVKQKCSRCNSEANTDEEAYYVCPKCGATICLNCGYGCNECGEFYCDDCLAKYNYEESTALCWNCIPQLWAIVEWYDFLYDSSIGFGGTRSIQFQVLSKTTLKEYIEDYGKPVQQGTDRTGVACRVRTQFMILRESMLAQIIKDFPTLLKEMAEFIVKEKNEENILSNNLSNTLSTLAYEHHIHFEDYLDDARWEVLRKLIFGHV